MYLDLQTQRHEFCLLSRWTPPALHSCIKSGSHTHPNRDTEVQWRKKKRKKKSDGGGKKTWIPAVVCVLEQVNSLYSRIAITSTLQQGCSWLELKAVWPDQTRGLFFLPFLLKCRYDQLPHCKHSYCFCSTFTNDFPHQQIPHNLDNFSQICPKNETVKPILLPSCCSKLV